MDVLGIHKKFKFSLNLKKQGLHRFHLYSLVKKTVYSLLLFILVLADFLHIALLTEVLPGHPPHPCLAT